MSEPEPIEGGPSTPVWGHRDMATPAPDQFPELTLEDEVLEPPEDFGLLEYEHMQPAGDGDTMAQPGAPTGGTDDDDDHA